MAYKDIELNIKEQIAYIGFGVGKEDTMATLPMESLKELEQAVSEVKSKVKSEKLQGLIFHSYAKDCFLAGVDVNLINSLSTVTEAASGAEFGQNIYNEIEDLPIPSVACVHGVCLGGGLELALSCSKILASDSSKTSFALPEVKLGLLPGFGGTYRLPRKISLPSALDLILSGRQVKSKKAKKMGLVEEVYPKERLLDMALRHLKKTRNKNSFKDTLEKMASDNFLTRKVIFQKARENVLKKTKGFYHAPLKILDVMESGSFKGRNSYLNSESQAFGELCMSDQSRNLRHIFFMMDGTKKRGKELENISEVKRGGVLGAGTMGGGIAWLFADNGQAPYMKDINTDALELGLKQSGRNFAEALKRRKLTKDDYERKQRSIIPTLNYDGFKQVDLVIEAVVENMDIKKKVFSEMEGYVRDDALITSNTSSLSVNEMAQAFKKPDRFAGLHFFNPVNRMPLVEIIRHDKVSQETIDSLYRWVLSVKKTPVVVGDGPGFLVNRILMPFINESTYLLQEGVSIEKLDQAVLNFGMPMGPCRLMDEVGIDVLVKVGKIMEDGLGAKARPAELCKKINDLNCLGKKSKKGFYTYNEKGSAGDLNEEVVSLLPENKIDMSEIEIQMRVFLPMINEAAYILDEGIVEKAEDVDLGLIFGIGFPPFRGGLLKYADGEGLDRIYSAIKGYAASVDKDRYAPSPYLENLVNSKKKFYES